MFPIKYIDNNLVWNKDNEVFAYYELIPYNYSFLSPEQKYLVHDSYRQLIAQSREGKICLLYTSTIAVSWNIYIHVSKTGFHGLFAVTIATVIGFFVAIIVLGIA